jgi:hypothetical protein
MRILVFCDEDLSIAAGGARQVLEFAKALSLRAHTIRIVAPKPAQGDQLAQEFASVSFRPVCVWRIFDCFMEGLAKGTGGMAP